MRPYFDAIPTRPFWVEHDYPAVAASARNIQLHWLLGAPVGFPADINRVDGTYFPSSAHGAVLDASGIVGLVPAHLARAPCVRFVSTSPTITVVRFERVFHCVIGELTTVLHTNRSAPSAPGRPSS